METIKQFLINTPWWVYVLLIYLIKIGFQASRPRIVSFKKLFIIPIIFLFFSIHSLMGVHMNMLNIGSLIVALLIGMAAGWWQIQRASLQVDREHGLVKIPGTWGTLIIILIIFASKYYFGYKLGTDPSQIDNVGFIVSMLVVSGICTGLFFGRLLVFVIRFNNQPSVNLQ